MPNSYFQFEQFTIHQDKCAMKVTTDTCLFGAWVVALIKNEKLVINNCLDIGTGTGLLALMFAQKHEDAIIDAIEIVTDSAEQAKENVMTSPWKERINVITADVKNYLFSKKYDLIISNPPFYENELKGGNSKKNIAHHNEGLLLEELLVVIKNNLNTNGRFCLLLPFKRNEEIKNLLLKNEFEISKLNLVKQSVKHDYFRIMLMGKFNTGGTVKTEFDEIAVWKDQQAYTSEFKNLLKDYYLYL